ncbi:fibronectin type III domain-containing protein [Flavobacterium sp. J49]|uniref:fibronectin type III domain-containing protein n=1 Tax=Flavobacterium sp. J49 TaxID=2718534 RepID=UPI0015939FC7|nr:fibronectin type III domain-containing protein [Flavobacterium sp. J49]MBF6640490.1 fibronectin type III domain-containing protein [Flavobacterium sp. J49]NIC01737.1 fibronectin type III domain-containing protein [Flavobacterium sp. J49]
MRHHYPLKHQTNSLEKFFLSCIFFLSCCFSSTIYAQGTTCSNATALTINGSCTTAVTISDTTQDIPNIGTCLGTFAREGWFTFTVSGGPLDITITADSGNRNLFLQLISSTAACTGLTEINCANTTNTNGAQTETITQTLSNGIYYIKVVNVGSSNMALNSICVTATSPCIAPTAQASGFTLGTVTSTTIPATFSGSANGFLVIRSLTNTPPSQPTNGTVYSAANIATLGAGLTFVQSGVSTSITDAGLTENNRYYYFIYAYNNTSCTGGPVYNASGALTGNAITCPAVPNSVAPAGITSGGFTLNWVAPTGGSANAITYHVQVTTDVGYTNNISGSPFSVNAPTTTLNITGLNAGTTYYYRILSGNGCNSSYVSGSATTLAANPCSSAATLNCGTINLAGTTVGSSSFTHNTGCTMSSYGKWYTFTGDGNLNTIAVTTTSFDAELSISRGSCGSLTNIACRDTAINGTETFSFTATLGVTYYVYVAYWLSGDTTTGTFTITRTCTTPFNPCASIPNIASCGSTINTTIVAGTGAYGTSACGWTTPGQEQIYTFTPTTTGNYSISQASSFAYIDYQFKPVSSGCNGIGWTCIDDLSGTGNSPYFSLTAGTPYYLLLDPESSAGGNVSFILNCPVTPPANDNCSGAIVLTVNPSTTCSTNTAGTTLGASQSQTGCAGTADDDVWYSFVATTTSHTVTVTPTTLSDAVIQAFSGNCGSLVSLDCVDDTISSNESTVLTGLTIGSTYYVRVYSYSSTSGQGTFSICVTSNIPCTSGNGNGGTSNNCPVIVAGGLGLSGADPNPVNACISSTCVDLEATYLQLNQTTDYTVQPITYNPPYQFSCLQNSVSINVDDVWSPTVTLPFNFCFYGTNYSQCLIGSNGTITFDLTNNTPGGYSGWSFANNLPNNTLFLNTIFGVYHDIDPSKGGEVGWELITLSTGCRALVASWNDIPMFSSSCNAQLYTGMIVLYENTNIIEVYIEEKNVCASWNSGNAIVGIQNANGTQAVVAPNRNGLDTNWTVTNEAWRFSPSGAPIASVKWYQGSGTSGAVLGTSNILSICPTTTTTYTAEVTYTLCSGSTLKITDETTVTVGASKVWNGTVDNDWNKPSNWTPNIAIPNSSDCVIIPVTPNNPLISGTNYSALAGTLSILNGAILTINSNNSLTVTDWVNVATTGTFTINSSASLVQINNVANTGNIIYKRDATMRSLDYVYWSSPVANYNLSNIAAPLTFWGMYKWNTTVANTNGGQGNWENAGGDAMIAGKGYIASGPSNFSSTVAATLNGSFTGVPNNGIITVPIARGNDTNTSYHVGINGSEISNYSDNWNLLGNPYPSAIRASQFLFDNNTKIMGNVKLWTHGTLPDIIASPFYNTFIYNYSPGDYLTYNFTGTSCCPTAGADLFIGSGQGFFVQMTDGPAASDNITFTNSLRSNTYSNSTFYRLSNSNVSNSINVENLERNRIWLDIIDSNNNSDRTLFGYIENATMGNDSFFDCITQNTGGIAIYSLLDDAKLSIQGRALPFDINDEVPIGINIPTSGNHTIALAAIDGLLNNQNIYLKDGLLNITHDLKASPYQFTSANGMIHDRFRVVYQSNALGNPEFSTNNPVNVIVKDEVAVSSNNLQMESIIVYNILGQKLDTYHNINTNFFTLSNLRKNNAGLLLNIKLQNGETVIKKVIY